MTTMPTDRMDAEQSTLLGATLKKVLSGPISDVEALLTELGWDEVVAEDAATATTLLFTEHGRALAGTSLLDRVVLDVLRPDLSGPADAVCYPALGAGGRPVSGPAVHGIVLAAPLPGSRVVVPVHTAGGTRVVVVDAEQLEVAPLRTLDDSLSWCSASLDAVPVPDPAPSWDAAVAAGQRALAAELVGVASEVLRLAVEHTSTRHQFGAPIAAFQAVRHRLADAHVAATGARALLEAAFTDGTPTSAATAKAMAGRAHETASANALQVCGAMGSSLEHPLHRFVNRGMLLDMLLGSTRELQQQLGEMVRSTGRTPRLVEV